MHKNLLIVLVLLLFTSEIAKGQTEVYLDVDLTKIDKTDFEEKARNNLIHNEVHFSETNVINKLVSRYTMGKLDAVTNRQLRTLLYSDSGGYAPIDKPLYVHYSPSFKNYEGYRQERIKRLLQLKKFRGYRIKRSDTIYKSNDAYRHSSYKKEQLRNIANCAAILGSRSNGRALFMYGWDQSNLIDRRLPYFLQDRGIIERIIFPFEDHKYFIALHPNGDYLMSYFLPDDKIVALLNTADWTKIKTDLTISLQQDKGIGFFDFERNIGDCSHEN